MPKPITAPGAYGEQLSAAKVDDPINTANFGALNPPVHYESTV